jgi:hypothetical protein
MTWAWVVIVAIAVGLPVAAWRLSRNLKPQRQRAGHLGADSIDRWLAEHYQLSALDRWQIEETIFRDASKLEDPRLREAARGLAAELLSGRLRPMWLLRWQGWILTGLGLAVTVLGIITHFASHRLEVLSTFYLIEGPLVVVLGVAAALWAPKQLHRNLMRLSARSE